MLFSSPVFLFLFFPIVLVTYFLLPGKNLKNCFLLMASFLFYFFGETFSIYIMIAYIIINYFFGLAINNLHSNNHKKLFLWLALIINISLLSAYKYGNFIIDNLNSLFSFLHTPHITQKSIYLPLGISFITFHCISYIVDIYNKKAPAQKDPIQFALYIALFPQLIAGPIIRYHNMASQLSKRYVKTDDLAIGIKRFIIGLGKKMLIANTLGGVADQIFAIPAENLSFSLSWLGIICYTLQIYFDFSGYSDMAIGLCRLFGFHILENFNYPYISRSIREFWRRWHISLSSWFRDYLYIPLGGNRKGALRNYTNLIIVFFLCGLWHGASWSFVIWGLYHGLFLILERTKMGAIISRQAHILQHFYAMLIIMIGWVFFRAASLNYAITYLSSMFGLGQGDNLNYHASMYLNNLVIISLVIGIIGSTPIQQWTQEMIYRIKSQRIYCVAMYRFAKHATLAFVFMVSSMQLAIGTYNPFIYFHF